MTEQRNIHDQSETWETILQRLVEELVLTARARDRVSSTVGELWNHRDELPKDVDESLFEFTINALDLNNAYQAGDTRYDSYYGDALFFRDLLAKYGGHVDLDSPWDISELSAAQEGRQTGAAEISAPLPVEATIEECEQRLNRLTQLDRRLRIPVESAMKKLVGTPWDAAADLRRCLDEMSSYLIREERESLHDTIGRVSDPEIERHMHYVRRVGNVACHKNWQVLNAQRVLKALKSMVYILEWWQETAGARSTILSARKSAMPIEKLQPTLKLAKGPHR